MTTDRRARYATVRVEDTGDGLIINAEDAKALGLQDDFPYAGKFMPDGSYRICIPVRPALTAPEAKSEVGEAEITTLRKEIAEARAVLEPFANVADEVIRTGSGRHDASPVWVYNNAGLTYGHFRRAAAALRPPSKAKGEKK